VRHTGRKPKNNPRFVVTNLKQSPRHLYEAIYCARGDIENRIKELHHGLEIDRTSCSRFLANQLRGLLSAAAYVLYQELRLRAARTAFRSAQVSTLREHLMKLGESRFERHSVLKARSFAGEWLLACNNSSREAVRAASCPHLEPLAQHIRRPESM
jgi:hypothetical protein